jgi:hypothetical protein
MGAFLRFAILTLSNHRFYVQWCPVHVTTFNGLELLNIFMCLPTLLVIFRNLRFNPFIQYFNYSVWSKTSCIFVLVPQILIPSVIIRFWCRWTWNFSYRQSLDLVHFLITPRVQYSLHLLYLIYQFSIVFR